MQARSHSFLAAKIFIVSPLNLDEHLQHYLLRFLNPRQHYLDGSAHLRFLEASETLVIAQPHLQQPAQAPLVAVDLGQLKNRLVIKKAGRHMSHTQAAQQRRHAVSGLLGKLFDPGFFLWRNPDIDRCIPFSGCGSLDGHGALHLRR